MEPSTAVRQAEVAAAKTMIERAHDDLDLWPERLIAHLLALRLLSSRIIAYPFVTRTQYPGIRLSRLGDGRAMVGSGQVRGTARLEPEVGFRQSEPPSINHRIAGDDQRCGGRDLAHPRGVSPWRDQ